MSNRINYNTMHVLVEMLVVKYYKNKAALQARNKVAKPNKTPIAKLLSNQAYKRGRLINTEPVHVPNPAVQKLVLAPVKRQMMRRLRKLFNKLVKGRLARFPDPLVLI